MTIIDMHVHLRNRSPCSIMSMPELTQNLHETIDAVCITDHFRINGFSPSPYLPFHVYFGVELSCKIYPYSPKQGDILAYGISELPPPQYTIEQVIDWIHNRHGCVVAAHPFAPYKNAFGDTVDQFAFDALEINGGLTGKNNHSARLYADLMGIPLIGGSDAHSGNQLNTIATIFDDNINSITDIVQAIKKHRCRPIYLN